MPYLQLEGSINFNNLIIWSFKNNKEKFIKNNDLKLHIEKLTACYQYHNGSVLDNPAIISTNSATFSNPTNKTVAKIEVLKNILLFTSILENNAWSFVTSDNFEVFYQRFNVGDENIATSSGAIHHISTGGYKIDEISFVKPEHINIPYKLKLHSSIINAFGDCLQDSPTNSSMSQVIQSLNPFFNSYRNGSEHSWASRILLLIMSFELLFGETERANFRKNIQKYSTDSSIPRLISTTYDYPIYNHGKVIATKQLSLSQIWAEEFYKLRNKIIHGITTYSDDFVFKDLLKIVKSFEPHFYIAVNFFVVCLLNKLRELGYSNVPHFAINTDSKTIPLSKNISGIKNELFKIEDIGLYDMIKNQL
jgi:hypothetical protein